MKDGSNWVKGTSEISRDSCNEVACKCPGK